MKPRGNLEKITAVQTFLRFQRRPQSECLQEHSTLLNICFKKFCRPLNAEREA